MGITTTPLNIYELRKIKEWSDNDDIVSYITYRWELTNKFLINNWFTPFKGRFIKRFLKSSIELINHHNQKMTGQGKLDKIVNPNISEIIKNKILK